MEAKTKKKIVTGSPASIAIGIILCEGPKLLLLGAGLIAGLSLDNFFK